MELKQKLASAIEEAKQLYVQKCTEIELSRSVIKKRWEDENDAYVTAKDILHRVPVASVASIALLAELMKAEKEAGRLFEEADRQANRQADRQDCNGESQEVLEAIAKRDECRSNWEAIKVASAEAMNDIDSKIEAREKVVDGLLEPHREKLVYANARYDINCREADALDAEAKRVYEYSIAQANMQYVAGLEVSLRESQEALTEAQDRRAQELLHAKQASETIHHEALLEVKKSHAQELLRAKQASETKHHEALLEVKKSHAEELLYAKQASEAKHHEALLEVKKSHSQDLLLEKQQGEIQLLTTLAETNRAHDRHDENQASVVEQQLFDAKRLERAELETALAESKQAHEVELQETLAKFKENLAEVKQAHEVELREALAKYKETLAEVKQAHEVELQEALASAFELQETLAEVKQAHGVELIELQEAFNREFEPEKALAKKAPPRQERKTKEAQKERKTKDAQKERKTKDAQKERKTKDAQKERKTKDAQKESGADLDNAIVISDGEDCEAEEWPKEVEAISENQIPKTILARMQKRNDQLELCGCKEKCLLTADGVTRRCINIDMQTICEKNTCSVLQNNAACANQLKVPDVKSVTTNHKMIALVRENSECGPYGVVAKAHIPEGADVIEYVGAVTESPGLKYGMQFSRRECDPMLFLDAEKCGNLSRFINHTCSPNLLNVRLIRRQYGSLWRIFVVATRDIIPGEAILVNYRATNSWECKCPAHDSKLTKKKRAHANVTGHKKRQRMTTEREETERMTTEREETERMTTEREETESMTEREETERMTTEREETETKREETEREETETKRVE
jgi:hypothetical protein